MFIRTIERENGKVTIIIVESVREGGKVKHKTIRTVATVLPKEVDQFVELFIYSKPAIDSKS